MKSPPLSVVFSLILAISSASVVAAPGSVDAAFDPNINDNVWSMVVQADGKIITGGRFTAVGGLPRNRIARLNANGTLDTGFDPNANGWVYCVTLQADGKIIVGGRFTTVGGIARRFLARLNADGTVDTAFNPPPFEPDPNGAISCAGMQADGKIVIGGHFFTVGGVPRKYFARLNVDGTLDAGFNPNTDWDSGVTSIALQPDGKVVIGGPFITLGGTVRNYIARFLADGTLDTGFNPTVGSSVYTLLLQPDGKILIGGFFNSVAGVLRNYIARLNANGTLDMGFNPGTNRTVSSLALQADGKIILGGEFTRVGGVTRNGIARLSAGGSVESGFNPNVVSPGFGFAAVAHPVLQPDGKILIAGTFASVGGLARHCFARLDNDPPTQSLTATLPNRVRWLRGGTAPEIEQISFELSTDGGSIWMPLGTGTRISGGWELNGLNLPGAGQVRARARTAGGYYSASRGLVESVLSYSATPIQFWREANFGTLDATGPAANNADPDKDGLENLIEYAFALNPNAADAAAMPAWQIEDNEFTLNFERPAGVSGVTYIAEYSTSLIAGSWIPAPNAVAPPAYAFYAPASGQRLYVRVRVTVP